MARRRYLSTDISTDARVNRLAVVAGDFAALLYSWMIPHAADDATLPADPEELLLIVVPGRRDKEAADIAFALDAMESLGLIVQDRAAGVVRFPESFYRHQSYITEKRRKSAQPHDPSEPPPHISANPRTSPQDSAESRTSAQNRASLKSSLSFSSSSVGPTVPPQAAPEPDSTADVAVPESGTTPSGADERPPISAAPPKTAEPVPKSRPANPKQDTGRVYALVDAFAVATKRRPDQIAGRDRGDAAAAFRPLVDDASDIDVIGCVAYLRADAFWREPGKITARVVARTLPEWIAEGRPDAPAPQARAPNGRPQSRLEESQTQLAEMQKIARGEA